MTEIKHQNFVTKWTELEDGIITIFWNVWNKPLRASALEDNAVNIIPWFKLITFFRITIL